MTREEKLECLQDYRKQVVEKIEITQITLPQIMDNNYINDKIYEKGIKFKDYIGDKESKHEDLRKCLTKCIVNLGVIDDLIQKNQTHTP